MSCNLVGGMLQRIDGLRKVGFGSMIIFGEDNKNSISGVWVFRGKKLGFEVCEDVKPVIFKTNEKTMEHFNHCLVSEWQRMTKVLSYTIPLVLILFLFFPVI